MQQVAELKHNRIQQCPVAESYIPFCLAIPPAILPPTLNTSCPNAAVPQLTTKHDIDALALTYEWFACK
jgi:hypothetical protein